jgi:outer membrane protein OmpA-like peptidoglycan-associated protein
MMRQIGLIILCGSVTVIGSACATKSYVAERVGATEGRLAAQVESTEARLRERVGSTETKLTSHDQQIREANERMKANRVAIDSAADQASGARSAAEAAAAATRDAEARLAQRIAERNRFRLLETRDIHFNSGQADIRRDDTVVLDDMAQKLKDDVNAVLELRGFADPLGSEQYNNQLTRDRVDAVIRYLVHGHGIDLRQLRAAAMGKAAVGAGVKPHPDRYASARRVEMRLLTPWSSWEDRQSGADTPNDEAVAASPATAVPPPLHPATPGSGPGDLLTREAWRDIVNGIAPRDLGAAD